MTFQAEPKSILVTGGAGFIGSCFVHQLIKKGHRVVVLDALTYAGHPENLVELEGHGTLTFIKGSICDSSLVLQLLREHQVHYLVNFAAESHVDRSIESPSVFIDTNIKGTFSLLNSAYSYWNALPQHSPVKPQHSQVEKEEFRYLQISTDEVYGSLGEEGKFCEKTPYAPNSPYSASKASGDFLVRAWFHTYGLPVLTTNCSNNYGPRQFPEKLIPFMILRAIQQQTLPIYGNGKNVRDWIHVEDHCEGIWLALQKGKIGSTYCFGGNAERTNVEVVHSLCRELDHLYPRADGQSYLSAIQFVKDRAGHDLRYAIDDRLAVEELGFRRRYDFEEGLRDTLKWYLEHLSWCESVLGKKIQKPEKKGPEFHLGL